MKVAQHEVLGWCSEKVIRPGRDGRSAGYTCEARSPSNANPAVRAGLLSSGPSGTTHPHARLS
jgi:hypothetical protein